MNSLDEKNLINNSLKYGQTLCAYAFLHKHINTKNQHKLCCISDAKLNSDDFNSTEMHNIRQAMFDNEPIAGCQKCYNLESQKIVSPRQKSIIDFKNELIETDLSNNKYQPIWYDLRISNNCNLACQMCDAESSSTIAKQLGIDNAYLSFEQNIDINPNSKRIYLAGGEPFLIKKFEKILSAVKNENCEIIVNTNGTIISKNLIQQLIRFKNVCITVSIDGYETVNDKIRKGSNWNTIVKNIHKFQDLGFNLHANTVLQKDNLSSIFDLGVFLDKTNFSKWSINHIGGFPDLKINSISKDYYDQLMTLNLIKKNISNITLLKSLLVSGSSTV